MAHTITQSLLLYSIAGCLLAITPVSHALPAYTFTPLAVPNATSTVALDINDSGQITGNFLDASGNHGFVYSNGMFTTLDHPNAASGTNSLNGGTFATGINAGGQIVGHYTDATGNSHGFEYTNGAYTTLDNPNAAPGPYYGTFAGGINADGQIVGSYYDISGNLHGFIYNSGIYSTLDEPSAPVGSNCGTICGGGPSGGSVLEKINDKGQITGVFFDSTTKSHGFLYSAGVFTVLNDPNITQDNYADGINSNGQIVGFFSVTSGISGFIYTNGVFNIIIDPNAPINSFNETFTSFTGINTQGQIVGYSIGIINNQGVYHSSFIATPSSAPISNKSWLPSLVLLLLN